MRGYVWRMDPLELNRPEAGYRKDPWRRSRVGRLRSAYSDDGRRVVFPPFVIMFGCHPRPNVMKRKPLWGGVGIAQRTVFLGIYFESATSHRACLYVFLRVVTLQF